MTAKTVPTPPMIYFCWRAVHTKSMFGQLYTKAVLRFEPTPAANIGRSQSIKLKSLILASNLCPATHRSSAKACRSFPTSRAYTSRQLKWKMKSNLILVFLFIQNTCYFSWNWTSPGFLGPKEKKIVKLTMLVAWFGYIIRLTDRSCTETRLYSIC